MSLSAAEAMATLQGVQPSLSAASAESWDIAAGDAIIEPDACHSRLWVADLGGGLSVEYRGSEYDGWGEVLEVLATPGVAPHIVQLRISGPDQGANGMKEWDFAPLIDAAPDFSRLAEFHVAISDSGDHNQASIRDDQLPALIARMPGLRTLTLPQAPEPEFFALDLPALRYLRTGSDWRTRGFIGHLADAAYLPALTSVDFGDSLAPFLSLTPAEDPAWGATPFADYERLFHSPVMARMRALCLRNTRLTEAEYRALQAIRPECQFSVVLAPPHVYVSHWGRTDFPHRHLLPFG